MRPDQLDAFTSVSSPAISPDGSKILFTASRMNLDEDRYDTEIHLWEAGSSRPFTTGPGDSTAKWSPDGSWIAFTRQVDAVPQLAIIPAGGGEAEILTDAPRGVRSVSWVDDGRLLVDWVEWSDDEDLDPEERARRARRVTSVPYRFDTLGWVHEESHRATLVGIDGDKTHLTDPIDRFRSPILDGDRIVFLADLTGELLSNSEVGVHAVPIEGGEVSEVAPNGSWTLLVPTPGGPVAIGAPHAEDWPTNYKPYRFTQEGPVDLAPDLDRSVLLVFGSPIAPVWTDAGLMALIEDAGKVGVIRIDDGGVTELVGGNRYVTGFSPTPDGSKVAFTASEAMDPGELWLLDGAESKLTEVNAGAGAELGLVAGERFTVDGDGGPIDAWVFLPEGDETVPLLLNVHGGPASQYGDGFFDEFQVYAAAGYGVVACNPRGSSGRGTDWVKAVAGGGWGVVDLADVTAVVDAALERYPRLDGDRMGVMGGSYGGFMTAWLTARDQRWSSSVVERALLSFPSFWGTSDIGTWFSPRYAAGAEMPGGVAELWAASPLERAHEIETPTLILHSEADFRCPIEQAEQLFIALLRVGTPTEFLRFPAESHELSRSGKPKHRRERFEAILEWHGRWLGAGVSEVAD